jgi:hypothetical protein
MNNKTEETYWTVEFSDGVAWYTYNSLKYPREQDAVDSMYRVCATNDISIHSLRSKKHVTTTETTSEVVSTQLSDEQLCKILDNTELLLGPNNDSAVNEVGEIYKDPGNFGIVKFHTHNIVDAYWYSFKRAQFCPLHGELTVYTLGNNESHTYKVFTRLKDF